MPIWRARSSSAFSSARWGRGDLDVDGGGEAEVEHQGDDVGGAEEEGFRRERLREFFAEGSHVLGGGYVAFLEGDEDFTIRGGHQGAVAEG